MNNQLNSLPLNQVPLQQNMFPPTLEGLPHGSSGIPINNIMSLLNVQNSGTSLPAIHGMLIFLFYFILIDNQAVYNPPQQDKEMDQN